MKENTMYISKQVGPPIRFPMTRSLGSIRRIGRVSAFQIYLRQCLMVVAACFSLPVEALADPPIYQDFIPPSNLNRPGYQLNLNYITIHNTDNYNVGADADNHATWVKGLTTESPSWHFTVDDEKIYQHLPINEVGWHAGDGGTGPGNRQSIGIELCVNSDGDLFQTEDNAAWLVAKLLRENNLTIDDVKQHNHWSGKNCPRELRGRPGGWTGFLNQVSGYLSGGGDTTDPTIANFSVSPTNITTGDSFTMSFRASDSGGSGLDFAQVWWTTDDGGSPDASNWAQYGANQSLASHGSGPVDKAYSITPPAGVYWFGLHLDDQAGNSSTESDFGFSPRRVTVSGGGTSSLVYQSSVIHDGTGGGVGNDDGQINSGEEIDLDVYLRNAGTTTITGISATLSSSSSYITITDTSENWPDIASGDTQPCDADFDFDVSSGAPAGHTINFTLSISSDQGSWSRSFSLQVVGGGGSGDVNLEYFSHRIDDDTTTSNGNDDGVVNPGETIELPVTLRNAGTDTANNVEAILSTSSPYVTITDDDRGWGDIAGGATDESSDFDFIVDGSCPDGHVIQFSLAITSDEGSWSDSFTITVVGGSTGGASFSYASSVIHDGSGGGRGNDNGAVDAGEEIDLDVSITNDGSVGATNVSATISTTDPYVVINDDSENLPDIGVGDTESTNGDFDFSILQTCPIGRNIQFDLEVTSDQGTTATSFSVQVAGALPAEPLKMTSFSIVPGTLNITFPSSVEQPYTLWRSFDLINWSPLHTYTGDAVSTSIEVNGAIGTEPKEFYKITQD